MIPIRQIPAELLPRVYVAGPLTHGDWCGNVRNALQAADELRELYAVPVIPHLKVLDHFWAPRPYEHWMDEDRSDLFTCHALVRLPGRSPGADQELALAREWGLEVFAVGPGGVCAHARLRTWLAQRIEEARSALSLREKPTQEPERDERRL